MTYSSTSLPLEKDHLRQEIDLLKQKSVIHLPHRWSIYERDNHEIMCKCTESSIDTTPTIATAESSG